jgi:hypothetical protein
MENKPWYQSRTLWANVLIVVLALAKHFGVDQDGATVDVETVAAVIGAANVVLRLVTKKPLK